MSVSSSSSADGPSLGQMLIDRAFSKPPRHMIDGELMHAIEGAHASDAEKVVLSTDEKPEAKVDLAVGHHQPDSYAEKPAPKAIDVRA